MIDGVTDTRRGDVVTPSELAARLDGVKLLFVGESHTDAEFHRVQLRVIQELHRRGRQVLVGLEMYPATPAEQQWLERWRSDKALGEEAFLAESHWYRSWGYHWNYYRDIFLFARESGIRLFGVNVPREVVQTARTQGPRGADARAESAAARARSTPAAPSTSACSAHSSARRTRSTGTCRRRCSRACTARSAPGTPRWAGTRSRRCGMHGGDQAIMVVLIGSGHVAYGQGAERQARLWFDGRTASVIPVSVREEDGPLVTKVQASYADFVWGLPPATDPLYPSVGLSTPEQKSGERYKVIAVVKDSPAAAAGFQVGDELVSIDGRPYADKETRQSPDRRQALGRLVEYKVLRDGQEQALTVPLRRQNSTEARVSDRRSEEPGDDGGRLPSACLGCQEKQKADGEPGVRQRGREGRFAAANEVVRTRRTAPRRSCSSPRPTSRSRKPQEREGVHQHDPRHAEARSTASRSSAPSGGRLEPTIPLVLCLLA